MHAQAWSQRKILFLLWLILFVGVLVWFVSRGQPSDQDQLRMQGRTALQQIANHNPAGICEFLSPGLIQNIRSLNFQELSSLPVALPDQAFCTLAARVVLDGYGDYYVRPSSIAAMSTARVKVHDDQAVLYFDDGENRNTSQWVKQDGRWMLSDGILDLIENVAHRSVAEPAAPGGAGAG